MCNEEKGSKYKKGEYEENRVIVERLMLERVLRQKSVALGSPMSLSGKKDLFLVLHHIKDEIRRLSKLQ